MSTSINIGKYSLMSLNDGRINISWMENKIKINHIEDNLEEFISLVVSPKLRDIVKCAKVFSDMENVDTFLDTLENVQLLHMIPDDQLVPGISLGLRGRELGMWHLGKIVMGYNLLHSTDLKLNEVAPFCQTTLDKY